MIKIKSALGIITLSLSFIWGTDHVETPPSKYLMSCVEWVAQKFAVGAALERSLAYPTESNITEMWRMFLQNRPKKSNSGRP